MTEVEIEIGKIWTDLWQTDIQPLYNKFPFEISSGEDISAEALKNATHPSGHFWQTYQGMLAPFCMEEGRRWRKRTGPFDVPKLPNNMLPTVNAVAQLSSVLWDKEGKERPLEFMLKPGPLPSVLPQEPIAVLSYLQVGESAVFGFNQKPSWKKFKYYWQNPYWSSVGVEFTTKDKSSKIKKTIEIPTSYWSFYRLLQKTEEYVAVNKLYDSAKRAKSSRRLSDNGNGKKAEAFRTLTWVINSPATNVESRPMDIIFSIQSDPWAIFKLPR
jgi:type VI protein secretion system component VasK